MKEDTRTKNLNNNLLAQGIRPGDPLWVRTLTSLVNGETFSLGNFLKTGNPFGKYTEADFMKNDREGVRKVFPWMLHTYDSLKSRRR